MPPSHLPNNQHYHHPGRHSRRLCARWRRRRRQHPWPKPFQPSDLPITQIYETLIRAVRTRGVERIVLLGTLSIHDQRDVSSVKCPHYRRHQSLREVHVHRHRRMRKGFRVRDYPGARHHGLWRVPILTNGARSAVQSGYVGDGKVS